MDVFERSMELHRAHRGKLFTGVSVPMATMDDLAVAYSPGVAEPSREIHKHPEAVYDLTTKGHTVAIVTDGSAVLGLGAIGPEASLPVMEGKAALFKRFADIDAVPLALNTLDVDEIVRTVKLIAPAFGGIHLEDISAPRCFEIERRLIEELDIPVMHDDQHGTAVVVLAGVMNACRVTGKHLAGLRTVVSGAGAAGIAAVHLLHHAGVMDIVMVDRQGIVHDARPDLNSYKREVAGYNVRGLQGGLAEAMQGADVFIGVSAPGIVTSEMVASMADGAAVFAMANPTPEIDPAKAKEAGATIVGTGRSDAPNQMNNVLAFPGLFKGALAVRARSITMQMKVAAAKALAALVPNPTAERIIPGAFDEGVAEVVAQATIDAWQGV